MEHFGSWKCKFFIFAFFVFLILDDFAETTYKKICCFYNTFSNMISNDPPLPSECFSEKSVDCFNSIFLFLSLNYFSRKNYDNTCCFYNIFSKSLLLWTCLQTVIIWNILPKMLLLFKNVNKLLLILAILSIICNKSYEKTYHDMHAHKILSCVSFYWKKCGSLKMLITYYLFLQLWATLATKYVKRATFLFCIFWSFHLFYIFTKS